MSLASHRFTLPALAALALAGCGGGGDQQAQQPAPPPPAVEVVTVGTTAVPNVVELPGRIEAVRSAEVRARTDGIIERRLYQEGTDVAEGTPLFAIDPRDRRAALQQAQAALSRATAARNNAAQVVRRYRPLVGERAVSAQENEAALSTLSQAEAGVADARAAVARAQLELGYTTVRAPLSGRVGRALVTEGALVSASGATLMTNIEQLNPVYAVFTQSNAQLSDLRSRAQRGELSLPSLSQIEVRLVLENGETYAAAGRLDFADATIDPSTGSQTIRARFPNNGRQLLPGQFVRGRIEAGTLANGITVPARAVQVTPNGGTVSVIGAGDTVEARPVQLGGQVGSAWVIRSGLRAGERVIVDGWQKVQPGQKVTVKQAAAPRQAPAGAKGR